MIIMNVTMKSTNEFSKKIITRNNFICFIKFNMCVFVINLIKDFLFKLLK